MNKKSDRIPEIMDKQTELQQVVTEYAYQVTNVLDPSSHDARIKVQTLETEIMNKLRGILTEVKANKRKHL